MKKTKLPTFSWKVKKQSASVTADFPTANARTRRSNVQVSPYDTHSHVELGTESLAVDSWWGVGCDHQHTQINIPLDVLVDMFDRAGYELKKKT